MIFSKMIRDPRMKRDNKMGRTIGLVFYPPRFWNCKKTTWKTESHPSRPGWMVESNRAQREAHTHCVVPWHMSYRGYVYWVGPKRRYQVHYMGDPNPENPNPWWGYVKEHGYYTRWLDNGVQPELWDEERMRQTRLRLELARLKHEMNGCLVMSEAHATCICKKENEE